MGRWYKQILLIWGLNLRVRALSASPTPQGLHGRCKEAIVKLRWSIWEANFNVSDPNGLFTMWYLFLLRNMPQKMILSIGLAPSFPWCDVNSWPFPSNITLRYSHTKLPPDVIVSPWSILFHTDGDIVFCLVSEHSPFKSNTESELSLLLNMDQLELLITQTILTRSSSNTFSLS